MNERLNERAETLTNAPGLQSMSEEKKQNTTQPDANLAAETRPVPSQAEGDLETVEEDLEDRERKGSSQKQR